jgi:hypothetical protein
MQALKRLLIGGLVLISTMRVAAAGELPVASPAQVGLSASKLNQAKEAVQALVDKKEVAGAVIAVARHGKVIQLEAVGVMDTDSGKPMKPDTIVRIFSMTKPITTVAAMITAHGPAPTPTHPQDLATGLSFCMQEAAPARLFEPGAADWHEACLQLSSLALDNGIGRCSH